MIIQLVGRSCEEVFQLVSATALVKVGPTDGERGAQRGNVSEDGLGYPEIADVTEVVDELFHVHRCRQPLFLTRAAVTRFEMFYRISTGHTGN